MYTQRKLRTSKRIAPAEPKKKEQAEDTDEDATLNHSPKKKPREVPSKKTFDKSQPDDKDIFNGKTVYFVPVEIPQARRNLLARRVEEFGGKVADELHLGGKTPLDYIVVDDRVALDTICRAMDNNFHDNFEKMLQLLDKASVVRAQWLSQCLLERKIVDDSEANINEFLKNHIRAMANKADQPSRSPLPFSPLRDSSPSRDESYHSDDDRKSYVSNFSDLGDMEDLHDVPGSQGDVDAAKLQKSNFFLSPAGGSRSGTNPNAHIIEQLEEMMKTYRNMGDEFRGYAYARAISAIRKFPDPILGMEQIKQLKNVGPRIASHIVEIVETGHMEKKDGAESNEATKAMNLFVNMHGVGTKTAQKWVQMGYRTLDDLKEKVKLTPEQAVGLKYYDEFQEKMTRREVEEIVRIVEDTVDSIRSGFIFKVCGSYLRGREMCGDVDLLMTHSDGHSHNTILKPLVGKLHEMGFLTDDLWLTEGRHKKYFGVCKLFKEGSKHRRLDIIIPPYNEWATCVLGWSGSMYFVRSIRDYAHKKGMSLTDYSLNINVVRVNGEKVNEGIPLETPTEESIFEALGLPYLRPEERDH
ncbi:hypothetical protein RvY_04493 [Ramazzottius varieornatus]|uniref:DNA polymerase n=1 Tax=Ramazzottius varieornatus TaxID=947166 RepID=A0A1D1UV65_RAMVA|nr:hypothetical protein RvY_04493 [Ramazzottius varieornatus]